MKQVVHWKREAYDVYIGRPGPWGNPFTSKESSIAAVSCRTPEESVRAFESWLRGTASQDVRPEQRQEILRNLETLRGKRLGCWCKVKGDEPCHGDVLVKLLEEARAEEHRDQEVTEASLPAPSASRAYVVCGTGHRPNKLGGYSKAVKDQLEDLASWALLKTQEKKGPLKVISGMAQGWDWALAEAAIQLELPWIAAVPCDGQESRWPTETQKDYRYLLGLATEVVVVNPGPYVGWKMQARNAWMVEHADGVLALWNGTPGGTANCLDTEACRTRPV
jgi:uncharacterized phage-like protein YoqJ